MKQKISQGLFKFQLFILPIWSKVASASRGQPAQGLGRIARALETPVTMFSDLIYTGSIILGASFILASIIKYFEHKRNPLMVPISTPVFLLVAGNGLIFLPFLSHFAGYGVPYSLFR